MIQKSIFQRRVLLLSNKPLRMDAFGLYRVWSASAQTLMGVLTKTLAIQNQDVDVIIDTESSKECVNNAGVIIRFAQSILILFASAIFI